MGNTVGNTVGNTMGLSDTRPLVICLMGPTASGKTDLAIRWAAELPLDLISVDSVMIYRGMNIGSAKPDAQTLAQTPHKLIDLLNPPQPYSAASFCRDAHREIEASLAKDRTPILVGGTMLYFKALFDGLALLPAADSAVRAEINQQAEALGWQVLHDRLQVIDPVSAARIHPNDAQRLQRALEVFELTGQTLTEFYEQQQAYTPPYRFCKLAVMGLPRAELHQRVELRFVQMLEQGLIEEVEGLRSQWELDSSMPSVRAVGYRQVWQYLEGELDAATMQEKAVQATRQLAKRQMTWLRGMPGVQTIDADHDSLTNLLGNSLIS